MIQMMMATIGGTPSTRGAQQRQAWMARKTVGFAIFTSGLAVIVAQALRHASGG
ncbi:UNVERIFIED_ORG: hypothetical protein ABIC54_002721 [Burkholderia sp. 1263]|mgnify:CR=1 FL=1|uniref:hypothetical protein n=1 Tax=Paraburkholderia terricola TaxID=169427 RepID=UPI0011ADA2BF|nr:hypothetical protein [Paraburkholderia terricola]MDR6444847.1 hypothetical protein [Paraburkholderia terricola]